MFAWSGFLLGLGAFQLWDGVINHKVLGLHQIRYGVDLLAYDIAWYVAAALLLIAGLTLAVVGRRRASRGAGGSAAPA